MSINDIFQWIAIANFALGFNTQVLLFWAIWRFTQKPPLPRQQDQ